MATLQYRPIDGPDFSSAMRALQMSGSALDGAFNSAQNTLGMLRQQQTAGADQEVLMRALRQQDADGMRSSLADGSLLSGVNPNRLSAGVLTGLQDRVGTLLGQDRSRQILETGAQDLEEGRYTFGRTQDLNRRSDAASPAINAIAEAASRGDEAEVRRLRGANAAVLSGLTGDQAMALAKDSQGLYRGEQQQRQGEFNLGRDRYNLSTVQRDDRENREANVLANNVLRMSAGAEDARAVLESMTGIDPNVRAAATRLVQGSFPGTYGPLGSGGGNAGGGGSPSAQGTAGTRNGNVYDTTYQFRATPQPISQMKIGDVIQHQSGMISSQGHSPLGAFQINKATLEDFGPRVLGKDWRNQNFDADAQNKIGEAIFNARKGGDLTQTWAALPDKRPGAYANMSWDQMRQQIASAETGQAIGASQPLQTGASTAEVLTRAMQNNTTGINDDFAQTAMDSRDAGQVVSELVGEGGSFAGADRGDVLRELNRVMSQGNVNAATASAVLRRNITNSPGNVSEWIQSGWNRLTSPIRSSANLGNGMRLNDDGVDASIQSLRDGSFLTNFQAGQETGAVVQQLGAAQSAYDAASAEYAAMVQRAQTQPGLAPQLPRYKARRDAALQRLESVREAQRGLEQLRPQFERTAPEPVAQSRGGSADRTTEILRQAATDPQLPLPAGRSRGMNW